MEAPELGTTDAAPAADAEAAKCQKCGGTGLVVAFGEAGEFGATVPCPECDSPLEVDFHPGNYFGYGYGMRWS